MNNPWSGGGGGSSPLTTKGDIYTRSASADDRLPVGTNGDVLTLDSAQALGIKWATPAAGSITYGTDLHWVSQFNGHGSTATKIGKWVTVTQSVTTAGNITYASSATNGDSWTINTAGVYSMFLCMSDSSTVNQTGISRNASSLTTNFISLAITEQLGISNTGTTWELGWGVTAVLAANDVIRIHTNGAGTYRTTETNGREQFWIRRLC